MHRLHIKDLTVLCSAAALLFCLSSCSSGELAPFSKNYESAEELTDMLIANYDGSEAQLKALKKNTAIHHFFTPEEADNQIARTLYSAKETADRQEAESTAGMTEDEIMAAGLTSPSDGESESDPVESVSYSGMDIYNLYAVCSPDSQWYSTLAIGDGPTPLMLFGLHSPYFSYETYGDLSYSAITDGIRDFFQDPQSVTLESVTLYPALLEDEDALRFPAPMKFAMVATVRAANGFGAYSSQDYLFIYNGRSYALDGPFEWNGLFSPSYLERLGFQSGGWPYANLEEDAASSES